MQQSRFELKYHLSEEKALRMRDFVKSYIGLDEYSVGKPNFSYPVHSLYLDSEELKTYWDTINGDKNRFKLRIRYYDSHPGSPVFFEVKRRMNHCIMKQRGGVRNDVVQWLLSGHHPDRDHLLSKAPKQFTALQRFVHLMSSIHASPKVHIAYDREAYVSDDDRYRVTFDRNIRAEANLTGVIKTQMTNPAPVYQGIVVLELKFTDRYPNWYRDLVEIFGVMQCGAAKYAEGVQGIGHRALRSSSPTIDEVPPRLTSPGPAQFSDESFNKSSTSSWSTFGDVD